MGIASRAIDRSPPRRRRWWPIAVLALAACERAPAASERLDEPAIPSADPIAPLPRSLDLDARKVRLGARLFGDPRLSRDGAVACSTCHVRALGLADGRARSHAPGREEAAFNAPTIFNVAYNYKLNWNGKFTTLEEQAAGAMANASAMNTPLSEAAIRLAGLAEYRAAFAAIYPDGVTTAGVADALSEYERSLTTPDCRFDRYLRGDAAAITERERAGYALFRSHGCISCHQGMNVGGNLLQRFGVFDDDLPGRDHPTSADLGRFAITRRDEDRFVFRVPSLRNVALTAPYFHDGSAATLEDAVDIMSRVQLGRDLAPQQRDLIVAFLCTLTGQPPEEPR